MMLRGEERELTAESSFEFLLVFVCLEDHSHEDSRERERERENFFVRGKKEKNEPMMMSQHRAKKKVRFSQRRRHL